MFCSNCGTELADGEKYCTSCGAKITVLGDNQNKKMQINKKNIISLSVFFVVLLFLGVVLIINNKVEDYMSYKNIEKLLVGTDGKLVDYNMHVHNIKIENIEQVEVIDVIELEKESFNFGGMYFLAYVNVKVKMGTLLKVPVVVEGNIFDDKADVKWDYDYNNNRFNSDWLASENMLYIDFCLLYRNQFPEFIYDNAPNFTPRDCMEYMEIYHDCMLIDASVSSVTQDYDALEYCVIWQDMYNGLLEYDWVRAEYDVEAKRWFLTDAIRKDEILELAMAEELAKYGEFNPSEYIDLDTVLEMSNFGEIE